MVPYAKVWIAFYRSVNRAWNPYLDEAERAALKDLVEAIGDFNLAAGVA